MVQEIQNPTYAVIKSQQRELDRQERVESIQSDAYVQQLVDRFDGVLDNDRIESIDH